MSEPERQVNSSYPIRPTSLEELDFIAQMWIELDEHVKQHSSDYTKLKKSNDYPRYISRWVSKFFQNSDALLLSALSSNSPQPQVCGFISAQIQYMPWYHTQRIGLIGPCFVNPMYRRRGIATAMVKTVESWLKEKQVSYVDVIWDQGNREAECFWRKLGFESAQIRASKALL